LPEERNSSKSHSISP